MLKITFKYWFLEAVLCLSRTTASVEITPSSSPLHLSLCDLIHLCSGVARLYSSPWEVLAQMQESGIGSLLLTPLSLSKRYELALNKDCLYT